MPENNITNIPSSRVELIDPRTGLMSRQWYRFFLNLFDLTGSGNNITSLDDLQIGPPSGGGESAFGTVTSVAMTVPTGLSVAGSPITSAGTLAVSYSSGYSIPTTAKQTEWDTAYAERQQWDGGATNLVAATGRTSLGATTVGGNFFTLPNPSAITFVRINADNTVSTLDAPTFRTAIGAGVGSGDVVGPSSATDNAVARYDTTTGKLIQNSLVLIDDTGSVTGVNALTAESLTVNDNSTLGFSNTDTLDVRARIVSDLEPNTNNAKDIGSSGRNWRDAFFGRTVHTVNLELTGTTSFDGQQGTSGQVLTSAGTGATPTWTTPTTGTVTSVSGAGTVSGLTLTGTVTSSGSLTLGGALAVTPSDFASQTANTFLAAPNGAPGTPTFRAIVAADVPTLNQNTTGTAANVTGTVAIANGGTGQTTAVNAFDALSPTTTKGDLIVSDGTDNVRLGVGADTFALVADSAAATGVKWASVGASLTIANDTTTATNLYPTFLTATSGTATTLYTGDAKLLYKPSTGELTSPAHVSSNGITINSTTVSTSYTIASGSAGVSAGPMTISSGVVVTVSSGSRWVVL
jgi:hypothetical protein